MTDPADQAAQRGNPSAASKAVGARLRAIRGERGVSLQMLAKSSGVSVGMISEVERGIANPSLRVLNSLRAALGISTSALFEEPLPDHPGTEALFVRRASERAKMNLGYMSKELLSASTPNSLQLMILDIPPGSSSGDRMIQYPAEKGGLVLEGQIVLTVGPNSTVLNGGDSFVFDSSIPHSFSNPSVDPAKVLWIIGAVTVDRHV